MSLHEDDTHDTDRPGPPEAPETSPRQYDIEALKAYPILTPLRNVIPGPPDAPEPPELEEREGEVITAALAFGYAARNFASVDSSNRALYEAAVEQVVNMGNALQIAARRLVDPEAEGAFSPPTGPQVPAPAPTRPSALCPNCSELGPHLCEYPPSNDGGTP